MATTINMAFEASHRPSLPTEIIDQIIRWLIPSTNPSSIALAQSHPFTKTLLSLTRVSRATYIEASRLLYTHCLYIDSAERLHRLSMTVSMMAGRQPSHFVDVPLIPRFTLPLHRETTTLAKISSIEDLGTSEQLLAKSQIKRLATLPSFKPHEYVTSLYLCPCPVDQSNYGTSIFNPGASINLAMAHSIYDLFSSIAPRLTRLVVDMKVDNIAYPNDDPLCIMNALRDVFEQCTALKYFCSFQGRFSLQTKATDAEGGFIVSISREQHVWHHWPKLQTLILHHVYFGDYVNWYSWRRMKSLKTVILARPRRLEYVDLSQMWLAARSDLWIPHESKGEYGGLELVLVSVKSEVSIPLFQPPVPMHDTRPLTIRRVRVPAGESQMVNPMTTPSEALLAKVCKEWVMAKVLGSQDPVDWQ